MAAAAAAEPAARRMAAPALLQVVLLALAVSRCQSQLCTVTGGGSYRWPVANPALSAPVSLFYRAEPYHHPLQAEFTGEAISVTIPPNFQAGFNLSASGGAPQHQYTLTSIQLRKPGRIPEGASQVLSHVLEAVLVGQEVGVASDNATTFATVVVPFNVAADADADMLTIMLSGADLPRRYGERSPVLLGGVTRPLDLRWVFEGARFLSYWAALPTQCDGGNTVAPTMQLMRTTAITTSLSSFNKLLTALRAAPQLPPLLPPQVAFEMNACAGNGSACAPLQAQDLQPNLTQALQVQGTAVQGLRTRKGEMDTALVQLQNGTVTNSYQHAFQARTNLHDAEASLTSAMTNVQQLQAWIDQAGNATWQPNPPSAMAQAAAATQPSAAGASGENASTAAAAAAASNSSSNSSGNKRSNRRSSSSRP
mmetsp:Transcript_77979/g.200766  ORF Transcript_77979/g.200766 Transcript_77979/m.200766 type:complete len:424 (+) Transcript_77979:71-1342(+)